MDKLMDYVCEELEELEHKAAKDGKLSAAETEYGNMLTEWKKNMLKVDKMTGENEFAGMSYRYDDMSYEGRNRNGRSYRSSYDDRGRGSDAKRDAMGRYSNRYSTANDEMIEELRDLMEDAPDEQTRKEFEKFIRKVEQM